MVRTHHAPFHCKETTCQSIGRRRCVAISAGMPQITQGIVHVDAASMTGKSSLESAQGYYLLIISNLTELLKWIRPRHPAFPGYIEWPLFKSHRPISVRRRAVSKLDRYGAHGGMVRADILPCDQAFEGDDTTGSPAASRGHSGDESTRR